MPKITEDFFTNLRKSVGTSIKSGELEAVQKQADAITKRSGMRKDRTTDAAWSQFGAETVAPKALAELEQDVYSIDDFEGDWGEPAGVLYSAVSYYIDQIHPTESPVMDKVLEEVGQMEAEYDELIQQAERDVEDDPASERFYQDIVSIEIGKIARVIVEGIEEEKERISSMDKMRMRKAGGQPTNTKVDRVRRQIGNLADKLNSPKLTPERAHSIERQLSQRLKNLKELGSTQDLSKQGEETMGYYDGYDRSPSRERMAKMGGTGRRSLMGKMGGGGYQRRMGKMGPMSRRMGEMDKMGGMGRRRMGEMDKMGGMGRRSIMGKMDSGYQRRMNKGRDEAGATRSLPKVCWGAWHGGAG